MAGFRSYKFLALALSLLAGSFLQAQHESALQPARVVFYNVENLYDTINDPPTADEDFLPNSRLRWNSARYKDKLTKLSRVVASMFDTIQPLVVGLAEIENRQVLEDL